MNKDVWIKDRWIVWIKNYITNERMYEPATERMKRMNEWRQIEWIQGMNEGKDRKRNDWEQNAWMTE